MKKIYTLLAILFLLVNIQAQETSTYSKHFISFRTGYSIPMAPSQIGSPRSEVGKTYVESVQNNSGETVKYSEKNSFGSRGAGLNFSLGYGYMINENFSVEIDFSYLYTLGFNDAYINTTATNTENIYFASQESKTSMFRVSPMLGVYANESMLIRPYAKFGILLPFAGATSVKLIIDDNSGVAFNDLMPVIDPDTYFKTQKLIKYFNDNGLPISNNIPTRTEIEAVTSGSFSLGFMSRFGAEYKFKKVLNGKLKLFAEMEIQVLTLKAHQTKIKKFYSTVSNETIKSIATDPETLENAEIDFIQVDFFESDLPEILLTTNYEDEITESSNSSYDVNNPNYDRTKAYEQLTFRDNYNSFAFIIGLKYNF